MLFSKVYHAEIGFKRIFTIRSSCCSSVSVLRISWISVEFFLDWFMFLKLDQPGDLYYLLDLVLFSVLKTYMSLSILLNFLLIF